MNKLISITLSLMFCLGAVAQEQKADSVRTDSLQVKAPQKFSLFVPNSDTTTDNVEREEMCRQESHLSIATGAAVLAFAYIPTKKTGRLWGPQIAASFDHIWKTGLGLGIDFNQYRNSDTMVDLAENQVSKYSFTATYLGASALLSYGTYGHRYYLQIGYGIAFNKVRHSRDARYNNTVTGEGVIIRAGYDYPIGKNWSVGLKLNIDTLFFPKTEVENEFIPEECDNGFIRFSLLPSLTYTF